MVPRATTKGRDAIRRVFRRRTPERPVVCVRLDNWHQDAVSRRALPPEAAGRTVDEIALDLGFAVAARFPEYVRFDFDDAEWTRVEEGGTITTTCRVGRHTMTSLAKRTPDMVAAVMALPMIVVFVLGQRYFVEGIRLGSVKG